MPSNTNTRNANISAIDFSAGRGSTGVDLRWYPHKEFGKLPDHKKELREWMGSQEGKKAMRKSRANANKTKRSNDANGDKSQGGNWKKKMKKALKTPHGLKSVMSVLAEEEKTNQGLIAALQSSATLPPPPVPIAPTPPPQPAQASALQAAFPSTSVKLQSILKNPK